MGWFVENKVELVSTGKVIAEHKVTGTRWTELGKFVGIILGGWILAAGLGSDGASDPAERERPAGVIQESRAPHPSGSQPPGR